jgi:hypothetical protein
MRRIPILFSVLCLAGCLIAQSQNSSQKIGTSAIWQVTPAFIATAAPACEKTPGDVECFMAQMTKAGAPPAAVAFTRELYKQSKGDFGIMTGFHEQGPVDFAWITYPLRANTNSGLLLVNGKPPIVDLEDLKLLDNSTMEQSFQFRDLKGQFPKVNLWPGDRDGKTWPTPQSGPDGGSQYVVAYPLRNGCHACENAGQALFTWNFDSTGKFLGTTYVGLLAPPLK